MIVSSLVQTLRGIVNDSDVLEYDLICESQW